jgi:DNA-binding GntR family transcriptional regulator
MKFNSRGFQTKSEFIYKELREKIVNGSYKPNQRVIQAEVARAFGTSEIPVREAFQLLVSEGLLRNIPHAGAVVTGLNMEELEEIYVLRRVLETLATKLAAKNIGEKDLKLLELNNKQMEKAVEKKKYKTIISLNREFHRIIYAACKNRYLYSYIFELWDLSFRIPGVFAMIPETADLSLSEHKEIFQALKNRDGTLAAELIDKHKEGLLRALRNYFKANPTEK